MKRVNSNFRESSVRELVNIPIAGIMNIFESIYLLNTRITPKQNNPTPSKPIIR